MQFDEPFEYTIGDKVFTLKPDFTFEELEWLDVVYERLSVKKDKNEVSGKFTKDEIEKTMSIILVGKDDSKFEHQNFLKMKQIGDAVKIMADFFLTKAILGALTGAILEH